jgi:iron complex transport system permease protein
VSGTAALARPVARRAWRDASALALLAFALAAVVVTAIGTGPIALAPGRVVAALGAGLGLPVAVDARDLAVVLVLRLPRTLMAALVGAVLGGAGAVMQGLFRNPLADPGLIGVSAGGAVGAVAIIVLGAGVLPAPLRPYATTLAAFAGALAITAMVQRIATVEGRVLIATMLLAGIVLNALAGAVTSAFIFAADDLQLRDIMFWTMGSCAGASWQRLALVAGAALPLALAGPWLARALNALILGEREAVTLGIAIERTKRLAVVLVALAVGAAVAATGTIGFIGIVAPHLVRLARGADHVWVLPAAGLTGAALLVAADAAARTVLAPSELPIGLVTALLGGPFFLALVIRQRLQVDGR